MFLHIYIKSGENMLEKTLKVSQEIHTLLFEKQLEFRKKGIDNRTIQDITEEAIRKGLPLIEVVKDEVK